MFRPAILAVAALGLLSACASTPASPYFDAGRSKPHARTAPPVYPGYGSAVGRQTIDWSIDSLLGDFLDLNYRTEWGGEHERLLRWELAPTVALIGPELQLYASDLDTLIATINSEAPSVGLRRVAGPGADITIRTAPREEMRGIDPSALCFFSPVDLDWPEYRAATARGEVSWRGLRRLEKVSIFIPAFAAPHVIRICLVEEVMQALGPGNDLFRLEDSGFNDDEVHVQPTAFDLLMLEALYAPELRPGMTEPEARHAAQRALRRILGDRAGRRIRPRSPDDADFKLAQLSADQADNDADRALAVKAALNISEGFDASDHRRGEAFRNAAFAAHLRGEDGRAIDYTRRAIEHFRKVLPPGAVRTARTEADLGLFLLLDGQFEAALTALESAEPVLAANKKEDDLTVTLRLGALALAELGRTPEAREKARQALDWAAYVYGADADIVAEMRRQFGSFGVNV